MILLIHLLRNKRRLWQHYAGFMVNTFAGYLWLNRYHHKCLFNGLRFVLKWTDSMSNIYLCSFQYDVEHCGVIVFFRIKFQVYKHMGLECWIVVYSRQVVPYNYFCNTNRTTLEPPPRRLRTAIIVCKLQDYIHNSVFNKSVSMVYIDPWCNVKYDL